MGGWRRAGLRTAFVPTMGNLHRGHLELVRQARGVADKTIASIFVNPLQFGAGEDFDKYPRTLAQDQAGLEQAQCDLLFAPNAREIYPRGLSGVTQISVPLISSILCGQFRPGHFEGVATVVNILLNLVQPDAALFGEKDRQQLQVIRRMVTDLHLPVEIIGVPTIREPDGLALSSRNQYLTASERPLAPLVHKTLQQVAERLVNGGREYDQIQADAMRDLERHGLKPQYVEIRTPDLGLPLPETREWIALVAAYLGSTRLIDNVKINR